MRRVLIVIVLGLLVACAAPVQIEKDGGMGGTGGPALTEPV